MIYWHNPRCSKSRQALALLQERGVKLQLRRYLDDPPDLTELREVATKLGLVPKDFLRKGEKVWKELSIDESNAEAVLQAMAAHPILIERPIAIEDTKAVIGRPPEAVLDLL